MYGMYSSRQDLVYISANVLATNDEYVLYNLFTSPSLAFRSVVLGQVFVYIQWRNARLAAAASLWCHTRSGSTVYPDLYSPFWHLLGTA